MFSLLSLIISLLYSTTKSFVVINGDINHQKPYYISSKISDKHKLWIMDAMSIVEPFNMLYTQEYFSNDCIRIHYSTLRYTGFTDFNGYLLSNNKWVIDKISIGINPNIDVYNAFISIILHELLHSVGLMHSDVQNSIMNMSIYVVNGAVSDVEYPFLHQDDIAGLLELSE